MTAAGDDAGRLVLRLRLTPEPDALARVLGVVLVAQARIRSVSYVAHDGSGVSELDIDAITAQRAETIRRRLEGLPCLQGVEARAAAAE